jgi:hypothetical protein
MSFIGDIGGFGAIADLLKDGMDKLWPDPAKRAEAELKIQELDNQLAAGQLAINQAEASNNNLFVSGWRPFIGWVCGAAFAYHYVFEPFTMFLITCYRGVCVQPAFDMQTLSTVLMGMLGLGTLRGIERMGDRGHLPWQK